MNRIIDISIFIVVLLFSGCKEDEHIVLDDSFFQIEYNNNVTQFDLAGTGVTIDGKFGGLVASLVVYGSNSAKWSRCFIYVNNFKGAGNYHFQNNRNSVQISFFESTTNTNWSNSQTQNSVVNISHFEVDNHVIGDFSAVLMNDNGEKMIVNGSFGINYD